MANILSNTDGGLLTRDVILTAVETESFSGYIWPELMDIFPGQQPVERSSMDS